VDNALAAESRPLPYWFAEVVDNNGNEAVSERDYFGLAYGSGGAADITEFTFVGVGNKFRGINAERISQLDPNGPSGNRFSAAAWGLIPSDKAIAFLQNHDTQHDCGISYRDGQVFRLANVWMLAQPYGYPSVLSSYGFACPAGNSTGPRSDANGWTLPVSCAASLEAAGIGDWVCEHRDLYIRGMVRFRKNVAGTAIVNWWDDGSNAIAFSRGDRGFVAINRESTAVTATVSTPLAPGPYCDLLTTGRAGPLCDGAVVIVAADGTITFTLERNTALAIDASTRR
jgi:alpha-amylase